MKRLLQICSCLFFCISLPAAPGGDRMYFDHLSVSEGLSQNSVTAIAQDSRGFIWIGTKDGLNRFDGKEVKVYRHLPGDSRSLGCNFVSALCVDERDRIWVGTDVGLYVYHPDEERFEPFLRESREVLRLTRGISSIQMDAKGRIWVSEYTDAFFCYDPGTDRLDWYPYGELGLEDSYSVQKLLIDEGGRIWLGDFGEGLFTVSPDMKSIVPFRDSGSGRVVFKGDYVNDMIPGTGNRLYVASFGGVWELDVSTYTVRNLFRTDGEGKPIQARCLLLRSDGKLLAGTESGLYVYDPIQGSLSNLRCSWFDPFGLSDNAIYSLFEDHDGGVWAGSWFGGADYCREPHSPVRKYYPTVSPGGLHGNHIREFCKGPDGRIWVGTEDGGLNLFDPVTDRFQFFEPSRDFSNVHGLCVRGNELWVGTYSKGLYVVDLDSKRIKRSFIKGVNCESLEDNSIFTIALSPLGEIYVGTYSGIQRFNDATGRFDPIPESLDHFIYAVKFDREGNLWAVTYDEGIFLRMASDGKWRHFLHVVGDASSLPHNRPTGCFEDSSGRIWITTQGGGFARYLPETATFKVFDMSNGLPNDVVYQMEEAEDGTLWLSTDQGLVSFQPDSEEMRAWTVEDGFLCDQYNYRSSFKDDDGTLYFGGIKGFVRFNPSLLRHEAATPNAVLTELQINGKAVRPSLPGSPLGKSISYTDRLNLRFNQNSIALKLSTPLSHSHSAPVMYRMVGLEDEWLFAEGTRLIRYPHLPPGRYRFVVSVSDQGRAEDELASLSIRVRQPWYGSVLARVLYALLLSLFFYLVFHAVHLRNEMNLRERIKELEKKTEKDMYESKIQFFTHIAHEIRTPVTMIRGPLDHIIQEGGFDEDIREDLDMMKKNSDRLFSLTSQLLDFRKMESVGAQLEFRSCNVSAMVREVMAEQMYQVEERGLSFIRHLPETDLYADVSPEAFVHIVSNLFSNAVKYADRSLELTLREEEDTLVLETRNDGDVIPPESRDDIFKPFVRYSAGEDRAVQGTGIGLVYARSLSQAHGGSLRMGPQTDFNVFILRLPLHQASVSPSSEDSLPADGQAAGFRTVLVVEDHEDMRGFIRKILSRQFRVLEAGNGAAALEVLSQQDVDLVVSDVMMPLMDGFELCRTIKSDIRFSHIPVILMTAKTDDGSKIQGMELGADAYVEKPFSMDYLRASISSLLVNRDNVRKALSRSPVIPVSSIAVTDADKSFIEDIYRIIAQNYSNTEFRMDDMASELHMSRTQFYRKIQGVLDMTPNDLLRLERLKHAAALLKTGRLRVSEVCYMTGFSSPSYFSKCFLKQFGVTPTDYSASTAES